MYTFIAFLFLIFPIISSDSPEEQSLSGQPTQKKEYRFEDDPLLAAPSYPPSPIETSQVKFSTLLSTATSTLTPSSCTIL